MYLSSLSQLNSTQYGSNASTADASSIQQMLAALAQVIQQLQTQGGTSSNSDASSALSGLSSSLSQLQSDAANGAISPSDVQNFLQQLEQVAAQVSSGSSSTPQYSSQDGFESGSTLSQGGGVLGRRAVMATVAGALGVDRTTLRSDIQNGMSITDVAQQQGVSVDAVKSAIESTLSQQNPQLSSSALSAIADRIIQGPPSGQQQGDPALLAQLQRIISG
jgi:hypothetical protein